MGTKVVGGQRIRNFSAFAAHRRMREKLVKMGIKGKAPFRVNGTPKTRQIGKYKAKGRFVGETWFPSKAEGDRYEQLLEMVRLGTIADLEVHPTYPCRVNGQLITTYISDFRYRIRPGKLGSRILVEDVKGVRTPAYTIKKKLVHALHGLEIFELQVPKKGGVQRYRYLTADQFHTVKDAADGGRAADDRTADQSND